MKKRLKTFALIFLILILLSVAVFFFYYVAVTGNAVLDENKLVSLDSSIEIYDRNGELIEEFSGDKTVTDISDLNEYTLNAFVAIEDKRFYSHHGVDYKGLFRAFFNNVKSFSFKEGASTISQQLIKNTHLSGEKTLKRKLIEMKLARKLENKYTKKEILEKYLNTIYFGESCYGITHASKKYFGIPPEELSVNQSAALAGIIKAPSNYSPIYQNENFNARKNVVLKEMLKQKYISEKEYEESVITPLFPATEQDERENSYVKLVKNKLTELIKDDSYNYKLKVYTYYDKTAQENLKNAVLSHETNTDNRAIVLDDKNKITAFYSTCGDIKRQMGSTIKPLLVFAPALDMKAVYPCSPILDEKININGYSPSNYKDVYYGYVSVKTALAKSLNSCAVKLLNDCGIEKCLQYLKNTDIEITENDINLSSALGNTEKGATLSEIAGAYGIFKNKGEYYSPSLIRKIENRNGITLYTDTEYGKKIFGEDVAYLINDMLKSTVKEGTAKTLSSVNIPLCAKTGTVGNARGNTDAYSISYDGKYTVAFWMGNKDNSLMQNTNTGGNIPTKMARVFWENMLNNGYKGYDTFNTDAVTEVEIDKESYQEKHIVEIMDENAPSKYVLRELFSKNNLPKIYSKRFKSPKIESGEITVKNNKISLRLCLAEYYDFRIYKEVNGLKYLIYDSIFTPRKKEYQITDKNVYAGNVYKYSAIPYFNGKNGIVYGEEYFFGQTKTPSFDNDDAWWR
ncbi:MAG: transglycosylase domain-containing protein [Clostridia bacterium]|nr:transglycosylase domain-containing protein [Clostridia bacterium]